MQRITTILEPPVPQEDEKSYHVNILYVILLALLAGSLMSAIGSLFFGHLESAIGLSIGTVGLAVALWLARQGYLLPASWLTLLLFLAVLTVLLYIGDGSHDIVVVLYPLAIVVASWVLGWRSFVVYAVLTVLTLQGFMYGEMQGLIPSNSVGLTLSSDRIYVAVIVFMTAATARTLSNSLTRNLMRARKSERALLESNRELEHEIAERRRAQAEILRLQHLLQNVTDSMPSALIALDPDGRVLTWNPAAESLTGQTAVQVQGQSVWQACPKLNRYQDLFTQVLQEGQAVPQHREQLTTEAGLAYYDASVFPLVGDEIEGAVLRIDDVTRRVQLEDMMLQSAKMASVGGLAAGVAHEINNPLGAMMQSAQMLQLALDTHRPRTHDRLEACGVAPEGLSRYLDERGLPEYLDGIRDAGARAAKIVSDLLSFSRKTSSDLAPRDLNALVEQTLDLAATDYNLKKRYDFRDIEIVRELTPDLPQVICDGQQIQQVVLNLVRNAAQAMANCELRPKLTLRTSLVRDPPSPVPAPRSLIRLEVKDNGPGIPEAVRARLFEPFFTTKEVGEGTGLGLWLCWSIVVERHDGRIWVEPVASGGSRFVVELPIVDE